MQQASDDDQMTARRWIVLAVSLLLVGNAVIQLFVADFDSTILVYADLIQATVDWDQALDSGLLVSYHARRLLVPWGLHYVLKFSLGEFGDIEALIAHQLFGLACSLAMVWIWHRVALLERLSPAALWVGALLLTANSTVAKVAYYFPAEPYPLKLALGLALLWAYLDRSQWGAFLVAFVGLFVFDVFFVYASLLIVFPRSQAWEAVTFRGERSVPLMFAAAFAGTAVFLRQVLDLDPDYPPTDHGPRWFIPVSIAAGTLYYYYLIRCLPGQWGIPSLFKLLRAASPLGILLVLVAAAVGSRVGGQLNASELEVIYPSDNWLPAPFDFMQPGLATHLTFWLGRNGFVPRSVSLPLVSYGSALACWSAAFPAIILLWPRVIAKARIYGWGVCLQLILGVLMMFDSEGRHQVLQIPLLIFLTVAAIDQSRLKASHLALLALCAVVCSCAWLTFGESADELLRGGWRADFINWGFGPATSWRNFWRGIPVILAISGLVWFAVRGVYRVPDPSARPLTGFRRDALTVFLGAMALSVLMLGFMTPERRWRWQTAIYETRYLKTVARLLAINGPDWHRNPPGPDYYCDSPGSGPGKVANYIRMAPRPGQDMVVSSPSLSFDRDTAYRVMLTAKSRFPRPIFVTVVSASTAASRGDMRRIDLSSAWTPVEFRMKTTFQGPARLQFHLGEHELEYEYEDLRCEPLDAPVWTLASPTPESAALEDAVGKPQSRLHYGPNVQGEIGLELSSLLPTPEPGRYELRLRLRAEGDCEAAIGLANHEQQGDWLRSPVKVRLGPQWSNYTVDADVPIGVQPRLTLAPQGPPVELQLDAPRWKRAGEK